MYLCYMLDHTAVLFFSFLRCLHTVFHNGCTNLHFRQQCMRVPFSQHPSYLLLLMLLTTTILTEVRWNLNVVLICISFISRDFEYFFFFFFFFWPFGLLSLKKLCSVCPFLHWLIDFFLSSLYIMVINPLSDV
jgi:hypothetical protein